MSDEPDLRRLLHDAVSDVEPARDLDDVRASEPPRRPWILPVIAAAAVVVVVLGGIGWVAQRETAAPPASAPAAPPSPAPSSPAVPVWDATTPSVLVYAPIMGPQSMQLAADLRPVASLDDPLQAAVQAAVSGRSADRDVARLWPARLAVRATQTAEGIDIDFVDGLSGDLPSEGAISTPALQSLVWTATAAIEEPDAAVRFLVKGVPTEGMLENDLRRPLVRDPALLAPITIDSIGEGETVDSGFTVSGLATAFEGTVVWRLLSGEEVVDEGFTTAEECCTPSPYSFTVDAAPGDYTLEVSETDPSEGEGLPPFTDTKSITVR